MWNTGDRLLAWMFAVQLIAAIAFGAVVVSSLTGQPQLQVVEGGLADGTLVPVDGGPLDPGEGSGAIGEADPATPDTDGAGGGTAIASPAGGDGSPTPDPDGTAGPPAGRERGEQQRRAETGGPGDRTGVTDDTIRIGTLVTQTGAINFRSSAQATRAYIDQVNARGGVHGRRIELLLRDDALDPNRGQQAMQEMLNAGVFSFVAFNAPLTEQSVIPVLERNRIPLIGAFAIGASDWGYLFSAPYETYGRVGGQTLGAQGISNPALVFISNQQEAVDNRIIEAWRAGLAEEGVQLRGGNVFAVDVTKPNFDDVVTSMRFGGVDSIGTILDATGMVRLQQSLNRAGMRVPHVSSPFGGDPAVLQDANVGSSFEGLLVLSDVHFLGSGQGAVPEYEAAVTRQFGRRAELNWAGQHGWLGAAVFVDALERAGPDPTRERLLAAMNSTTELETGFTVPLTIGPDAMSNVTNNACMKVAKVSGGKAQQVANWACPELTMTGDGGAP